MLEKSLRNFLQSDFLFPALLFLVVVLFYWPTTAFSFLNFDDPHYVTNNPNVLRGLTIDGTKWAFSTFTMGHWHPLTWISHMVDVSIFGIDPWGHHLVNILIFAFSCSLVFLFLRKLKFEMTWAYLGVLFFSLHPLRLESVAWVSERKDVLSLFFGVASFLTYLMSHQPSSEGKSNRWLIGSLLLFLFSLLAKPTFVSLPILIIFYEITIHKSSAAAMLKFVPFFILSACSSSLVYLSQASESAINSIAFSQRLENLNLSYWAYFAKFFWPWEVAIFYPKFDYPTFYVWIGILGLGILSWAAFHWRKKYPLAFFGWFWFLISAFPISGFVPIGWQAYADRWTLLPHLGLLIAVISILIGFKNTIATKTVVIVSVAATAAVCIFFMPHWASSESIFRHSLNVTDKNFMAHMNLAVALDERGQTTEADRHYELAVQINPHYPDALNNLGASLARRGKLAEARTFFIRALQRNPKFQTARSNLDLVERELKRPRNPLQ